MTQVIKCDVSSCVELLTNYLIILDSLCYFLSFVSGACPSVMISTGENSTQVIQGISEHSVEVKCAIGYSVNGEISYMTTCQLNRTWSRADNCTGEITELAFSRFLAYIHTLIVCFG